jgi:hypothetical protein
MQFPVNLSKIQGIILFLAALFLFAAVDTTIKYLSASFTLPLLIWARFVVHQMLGLRSPIGISFRIAHGEPSHTCIPKTRSRIFSLLPAG